MQLTDTPEGTPGRPQVATLGATVGAILLVRGRASRGLRQKVVGGVQARLPRSWAPRNRACSREGRAVRATGALGASYAGWSPATPDAVSFSKKQPSVTWLGGRGNDGYRPGSVKGRVPGAPGNARNALGQQSPPFGDSHGEAESGRLGGDCGGGG